MQSSSKLLLIIILLVPQVLIANSLSKSVSPNGKTSIEWKCMDEYEKECNIHALSNGRSLSIFEEVPAPRVTWHGPELAQIRVGCGSPCFSSKFYSPSLGISETIDFVMAVAPDKPIAAHVNGEVLEVVHIFDKVLKPIEIIHLDFSDAATIVNVIEQVKFVGENKLYVRYLSGPDYTEKERTIPIKGKLR